MPPTTSDQASPQYPTLRCNHPHLLPTSPIPRAPLNLSSLEGDAQGIVFHMSCPQPRRTPSIPGHTYHNQLFCINGREAPRTECPPLTLQTARHHSQHAAILATPNGSLATVDNDSPYCNPKSHRPSALHPTPQLNTTNTPAALSHYHH